MAKLKVSGSRHFPSNLKVLKYEIEQYARSYGLDFFETIFEVLDYEEMSEFAALGGFPSRYPHWRFGMEYEELHKGYSYGLSKIYEMVINTNPCYAYLLRSNNIVDQKIVMAHVYAHCDFFKNNVWFSQTNRKMMDRMADHGTRIQNYVDRYGTEEVEAFLDACLSIEDLIDQFSVFTKRKRPEINLSSTEEEQRPVVQRIPSKDYMGDYINPRGFLDAEKEKVDEELEKRKRLEREGGITLEEPDRDVLLFLIEHAPLENWQKDILAIIREEAYYFAPQGQTKIMNEGWASYWHSTIMTQKVLDPSEVIDYADHHSGTLAVQPGRINPYKLGIELLRDIEDRWNRGRHGKEFNECEDREKKKKWDTHEMAGRAKIFEIRKVYNDVGFIDEFLTPEFCRQQKMFVFKLDKEKDVYEIESREFEKIKQKLLFSLTNHGRPLIYVVDGNYRGRGELLLVHKHQDTGMGLDIKYARAILENLARLWQRTVHVETIVKESKEIVLSFDGREHTVGTK